jgi:hypothetical protein
MIINEISKGITHIEDLPLSGLLKTLKSLHEYEVTEKVDGAQILFGIDEVGLYTSRESKGGIRIYNEADYKVEFRTTYMRSAHLLLEKALPFFKKAGLRKGDQIEAEVLFGELPNVVPYSEDLNYIIFLRTTEGTISIDKLNKQLNKQSFNVSLISPFTDDGRYIKLQEEYNTWLFSRVPKIRVNIKEVMKVLDNDIILLEHYLSLPSGIANTTNLAIESLPLNKRPDWCESEDWKFVKEQIKEKREEIKCIIEEEHILKIKETLLDYFVQQQHSSFGPPLEDGGWIEGVVLRHTQTGKMVKIVDKNNFGVIREAAWKIRNSLTEHAKSIEGDHSFLGNMYVRMATSIGHPELGTMQAKNYLRKLGSITEERLNNLSEGIDVDSIKEYWLSLFEQKEIELEEELVRYEKEKTFDKDNSLKKKSVFQESSLPNSAVGFNKRTEEVFASLFEQISVLIQTTERVKISEELIEILVGKQLKDLS